MVTISDLAADTGLSVSAVSQILNGKGRFAEVTRSKVLDRARSLGYRLNQGARATRTRRFEAVGLLTIRDRWKGGLPEAILAGVEAHLTAARCQLLVESVGDADLVDVAAGPAVLTRRSCDAMILNYHLPPPAPVRQAIAASRVPAVWLNLDLPDQACVRPDDDQGARLAVAALVAASRRRLAYLDYRHPTPERLLGDGTRAAHDSVLSRRAGFVAACEAAGIEPRIIAPPRRLDGAEALAYTRDWMRADDRPDGMVTYGAREALMVLRTMWELGREPGVDAGVITFGLEGHIAGMPVATVRLPYAELGRRAAEAVLAALAAGTTAVASAVIPCTLVDGPTL